MPVWADYKKQIQFTLKLNKQNILKCSINKLSIPEYQQKWIIDRIINVKSLKEISDECGKSTNHIDNYIKNHIVKLYNYKKYLLEKVPFKKLKLDEVPLPWRIISAVSHYNLDEDSTIGELMELSIDELLKIRGFGWSKINKLQTLFQNNGRSMKGYELKLLKMEILSKTPKENYLRQILKHGDKTINVLIHNVINNGGVIIINPEKTIDNELKNLPKFKMIKGIDNNWELKKMEER